LLAATSDLSLVAVNQAPTMRNSTPISVSTPTRKSHLTAVAGRKVTATATAVTASLTPSATPIVVLPVTASGGTEVNQPTPTQHLSTLSLSDLTASKNLGKLPTAGNSPPNENWIQTSYLKPLRPTTP